jgi:hypothetical protein
MDAAKVDKRNQIAAAPNVSSIAHLQITRTSVEQVEHFCVTF